jgi:hypothetical protein
VLAAVLLIALIAALAVPAAADRDDPMVVGRANGAKGYMTSLYSTNPTATLMLVNNRPAGSPALRLQVKSGPPLTVNTKGLVANLNADLLDGKQGSAYAPQVEYVPFQASINEGQSETVYDRGTFAVAVRCRDAGTSPDHEAEVRVTSSTIWLVDDGVVRVPGTQTIFSTTSHDNGSDFAAWTAQNEDGIIIDLTFSSAETPHTDCMVIGSVTGVKD